MDSQYWCTNKPSVLAQLRAAFIANKSVVIYCININIRRPCIHSDLYQLQILTGKIWSYPLYINEGTTHTIVPHYHNEINISARSL